MSARAAPDPSASLSARTALVSGAASDIGRAVCAALQGAGATVLATDLPGERLDALVADLGIEAIAADLTDPDRAMALGDPAAAPAPADRAAPASGDPATAPASGDPATAPTLADRPIDILAAVAGLPVVERFAESDPAGWDRLWQVNLRAPMLLTRALLPGMAARGWGRLVFVSSDSARAGAGGEAVYAATKAGLLGFAKSVAREAARDGVTANVVCPGPIDTERSRAILEERPRLRESLVKAIPVGALGAPTDVAAAVAYLASPAAGYVTGQTLSVNGGITMN
ncbi:MAG TPA: SDR family oxidoreductase [Solirubrobacterales bacterium]